VDVVSSSSILPRHDRMLGGGGRYLRRTTWAAAAAVSVVAFGSSCRLERRMLRMFLEGERRRAYGAG
jgi:hypothetical protein